MDGVEVGIVEVAGAPVSATRIRASLSQGMSSRAYVTFEKRIFDERP